MTTRRAAGALLATVALVSIASLAGADDLVLHEMVPGLTAGEGAVGGGASSVVMNSSAEPAAIVTQGEILRAPEGGPLESDEQAVEARDTSEPSTIAGAPAGGTTLDPSEGGASAEAPPPRPTFAPDRITALHGAIPYFEVFRPAITPYKRVTAFDAVALAGEVPILTVASRGRRPVPIEGVGAPTPDGRERDRFWGSVVLDFAGGREVPFPSVSPESRILSLRTEPEVELRIERDAADNFVAVLASPPSGVGATSSVRVVFLTDAPRSYFGLGPGESLEGLVGDAPSDALASSVPRLPPEVERDATRFAAELGLRRGMPFRDALTRLAAHFRSFEESEEPPTDTGNVFLDLARGMRGVCRHRAYAFVITAQALGMQARFVSNEAHAWVEVHLPAHRGWLRVDLGGSAAGLAPRNDAGPAYQPAVADPLPRPEAFARALEEATAQSRTPQRGEGASGGGTSGEGTSGSGASGSGASGSGDATNGANDGDEATGEEGAEQGEPDSPFAWLLPPPRAPAERRIPLELRVDQRSGSVLRGQTYEVTGTARSSRGPAEGVRVEVLLALQDGSERLLGVTLSDASGVFHGSFGVPIDTPVGEHLLIVRSPGDPQFLPAAAR